MIPALQETVRYILYLFRNLSGLWKKVDNDFSACGLNDTVVILVQGYTLSYYAIGGALKRKLEKFGFKVFAFVSGSTMRKPIEATAGALGEFVEQVCQRCGVNKVCLVGHSMGGLISLYYLEKLGGDKRVKKIITAGTPFHGTFVAYLGIHTAAARQMVPKSGFLQDLLKNLKYADRIISVRTPQDQVVKPQSSSILAGANNIEAPSPGHIALIRSDNFLNIVKKELQLAKS